MRMRGDLLDLAAQGEVEAARAVRSVEREFETGGTRIQRQDRVGHYLGLHVVPMPADGSTA